MSTKKGDKEAKDSKGDKETPNPPETSTASATPQPAPEPSAVVEDFDPLAPPVIERAHVKENMGMGGQQSAEPIPEDNVKVNPLGNLDNSQQTEGSAGATSQSSAPKEEKTPPIPREKPFENTEAKDMSKAQKRREAEKSADALLFHYCLYIPMPFKAWASFNDRKIERLALEDKINLNMSFQLDAKREKTVKEYMEGVNKDVDSAFTVSEERKQEIREPLIEVLMEQGMVLTAQQRLMMAVGSHVAELIFSTVKIANSNNQVLDVFMKIHAQKKEEQRQSSQPQQPEQRGGGSPPEGGSAPSPEPDPQPERPVDSGYGQPEESGDDESHEEGHNDESVSAVDETTGEAVEATVVESTMKGEEKSKKKKAGGRPKGTGTRKTKNAISVDEAIESAQAETQDDILGTEPEETEE